MLKTATSELLLKKAGLISDAVMAEAEEILEDTENAIKSIVPARYVKRALAAVEESLDNEGVEALFEKKLSRETLRKAAALDEKIKKSEFDAIVASVTDAVTAEFEDVLKDTDDVADETVSSILNDDEDCGQEDAPEVEAKLKNAIESKLAGIGIYTKLDRKHKVSTAAVKDVRNTTASKNEKNLASKAVESLKSARNARK